MIFFLCDHLLEPSYWRIRRWWSFIFFPQWFKQRHQKWSKWATVMGEVRWIVVDSPIDWRMILFFLLLLHSNREKGVGGEVSQFEVPSTSWQLSGSTSSRLHYGHDEITILLDGDSLYIWTRRLQWGWEWGGQKDSNERYSSRIALMNNRFGRNNIRHDQWHKFPSDDIERLLKLTCRYLFFCY